VRDRILQAASDPVTIVRFASHVHTDHRAGRCWIWMGAISGKGHGRFWVRDGFVVVAQRLAYAIATPNLVMMPSVVAHRCDTPPCQNPDHLEPSNSRLNYAQWLSRRNAVGGPLRDSRGALGRSLALRDAARQGVDLDETLARGVRPVDRDQPTLF